MSNCAQSNRASSAGAGERCATGSRSRAEATCPTHCHHTVGKAGVLAWFGSFFDLPEKHEPRWVGEKMQQQQQREGEGKKEFVFVGDEQRWQQQQQQRRKSATKTATPETSPTTATTRRRRSSRGRKHRTRTTLSTMALLAARWLGAFGTSHSAVGAFSACSGRATERGQLDSDGGVGGEREVQME